MYCFTLCGIRNLNRWTSNEVFFKNLYFTNSNLVKTLQKQSKWFIVQKSKSEIDQNIETRRFKKFHSSCKNLDQETKSGSFKTVDSEAVLQAI